MVTFIHKPDQQVKHKPFRQFKHKPVRQYDRCEGLCRYRCWRRPHLRAALRRHGPVLGG